MAKSPYPIVWNFYRKVDEAKELGGVVHYFNEDSQSLYLNNGLATKIVKIDEGHWRTAIPSDEIKINNETSWNKLRIDHVSNSCLYGVVSDGSKISFIRYVYGLNLSNIMNSWDWRAQVDNSITQFNASVMNINSSIFGADASLLQPGARMTLYILMGDSDPYPISVIYLDEVDNDDRSDTISISGRNTIGYYLKDQTFDDKTNFNTAKPKVIIEKILKHAGITKFLLQDHDKENTFTFKPSDSILSGLEKIKEYYTDTDHAWEIVELPDGTVCIGFDNWVSTYLPKGYYIFDEGSDVFVRKTRKSGDGAFTSLRVTGKTANGTELTPVTVEIKNYKYWSLGKHKTKHIQAPDGKTQEELQTWAETQAKKYQYSGITEDFTGPFRPQLLVGDVAVVKYGETGSILGIITEVRHTFSTRDGFKTEFSVDSGGVALDDVGNEITDITDIDINNIVYSRAAALDGYNRKQRIIDMVRRASN